MNGSRSTIDFEIVSDNITDLANFTVEKYELRSDSTLPPELRERAIEEIKLVVRQRVEEMELRRKQVLARLLNAAEEALHGVIEQKR